MTPAATTGRTTHATCRICRRHRRVGRQDDDGRAVCVACVGEAPAVHTCPDCGGVTPGTGAAPCMPCSLRRRVERRVAVGAEGFVQPWVRALFLEFCAWDGLPRTAGNMARRIDSYAAFFAEIDRHCAGPAALGQKALLALFGPEGLRRRHLPVRFLVGRLSLEWEPARTEGSVEHRRIKGILAAADLLANGAGHRGAGWLRIP